MITGYLFSRYGMYATVLMHFLTDYISSESWFFNTSDPVMTIFVVFMLSVACFPYTYIYVKKGIAGKTATVYVSSADGRQSAELTVTVK